MRRAERDPEFRRESTDTSPVGAKSSVLVCFSLYRPLSDSLMRGMPLPAQGAVMELLGFLMAAAIIGAFELTYSRTSLSDSCQRYLAHFTKFTLCSSILLLMDIRRSR